MVERLNGIQEVRGSTPLISTTSEQGFWSCSFVLQKSKDFSACSSFSHKSFASQNFCGSPEYFWCPKCVFHTDFGHYAKRTPIGCSFCLHKKNTGVEPRASTASAKLYNNDFRSAMPHPIAVQSAKRLSTPLISTKKFSTFLSRIFLSKPKRSVVWHIIKDGMSLYIIGRFRLYIITALPCIKIICFGLMICNPPS